MHQNVSVCQSVILSCFDLGGRRNKIVYEELNFPSVMYVYEAHRDLGARIGTVPSDDGITVPLDRLLAAIDEETLLVPLSHVVFKSGFVQDVAAIVARAHEVGACVVADLYQSAGTVPVDVTAWDVDFATGGSVKWLCGGPGAGYLYVAPRLRDRLQPRVTGWMAHEHPFAFEPGPIEYARRRRALPARHAGGARAVRRAGRLRRSSRAIGVEAIRAQVRRQVQLLIDLAARARLHARARPTAPEQRGGMVILDVPARRGGHARAAAPRDPGRLSSRGGHPLLPALLHERRRARPRGRRDRGDPRRRGLPRPRSAPAGLASEPGGVAAQPQRGSQGAAADDRRCALSHAH